MSTRKEQETEFAVLTQSLMAWMWFAEQSSLTIIEDPGHPASVSLTIDGQWQRKFLLQPISSAIDEVTLHNPTFERIVWEYAKAVDPGFQQIILQEIDDANEFSTEFDDGLFSDDEALTAAIATNPDFISLVNEAGEREEEYLEKNFDRLAGAVLALMRELLSHDLTAELEEN